MLPLCPHFHILIDHPRREVIVMHQEDKPTICAPGIPVPESILRIGNSSDRALAWYFFIFFARFEYALKRDPRYLMAGIGDACPNWDKFGSEHNSSFQPSTKPDLADAVEYFLAEPPRKQLRKDSAMTWSEPQYHNGKEPQLIWLLRMIRCMRNNLFHGGKFPLISVADPSRDRDLLLKAMTILTAALSLDLDVDARFNEGLNE